MASDHSFSGKPTAEAFTVQTKHGLVYCTDYPFCLNTFSETSRWGEKCEVCIRNRYRSNKEQILAPPDNYLPKNPEEQRPFHSASQVKELLISEVVMKLEALDEKQLVPGCTVLFSVNIHGATIDISIIDNLMEAKKLLAATLELIQKAAALYLKSTPAE